MTFALEIFVWKSTNSFYIPQMNISVRYMPSLVLEFKTELFTRKEKGCLDTAIPLKISLQPEGTVHTIGGEKTLTFPPAINLTNYNTNLPSTSPTVLCQDLRPAPLERIQL